MASSFFDDDLRAKGLEDIRQLLDVLQAQERDAVFEIYRVSHIKCSTVPHERGCAACTRREQGNSQKGGCSQNSINCSEPFPCPIFPEK
jgi:hypothetical protein